MTNKTESVKPIICEHMAAHNSGQSYFRWIYKTDEGEHVCIDLCYFCFHSLLGFLANHGYTVESNKIKGTALE